MDFTLLQSITESANEKQSVLEHLALNLPQFENPSLVCETAEEFLMQVYGKIQNNGTFAQEEIDRIAPVLATLQLLTREDTRSAILSRFKGDEKKNLITITQSVSKPSDPSKSIDQVLSKIGQVNGRSLMDKNAAMLNDPQSQGRKQLVADLQKMAGWFRSYGGKMNGTPAINGQQQSRGNATNSPTTQQPTTQQSSATPSTQPSIAPSSGGGTIQAG